MTYNNQAKRYNMTKINYYAFMLLITIFTSSAYAAPAANLWSYWNKSNPTSVEKIDFQPLQKFLDKYVVTKADQTYVGYANITAIDKQKLNSMIKSYSKLNILNYNKNQQLAYWIDMYNMLTIQVILEHYPVKSITGIDKNWLGYSKVWDQKVITIMGKSLTLNDMEHRIIRPIWKDPRIHSAVNCASFSCPNISVEAYNGNVIDKQLNTSFSAWVNSHKGVVLTNSKIYLSQIFNWYGSDFGNETQMRDFISNYVNDKNTKGALLDNDNKIFYKKYNWNLNEL